MRPDRALIRETMTNSTAAVLVPYRVSRSALLRATALQGAAGLVLSFHAAAQPAPSARPTGGQVVAGAASIAAAANTTTITQSSNRAAIDWQSYNVGSNQAVIYQQPSATAVTLNRVTGGDPSAIAGKITANGQLIITNPSGVTFYQGAQVNAQSVVVSAAGITNQNFMAGKMVFDQAANPNARIDNRGTITVKQAGLAALVAPSVANSGVINARLGQVVLAGAAAHTLDLYGDGLVSIDVTKQVMTAPVGPGGKPVTALVTNTGVIQADGGVVQLTAAAADGVVQTLVRAGGRIQANTVGSRTGRIEITGTGGSVVVEGRVAADGKAPGSSGGQIMVAGSDTTTLAAGSHVSADGHGSGGHGGGGLVAVGTTLARAAGTGTAPAGTSARTVVASGARVSASGTGRGDGGRVTVLSTQNTVVAGVVSARGGKAGGDGGTVELSGQAGFTLTGTADTAAPHGALGSVVLDPYNLTITATPDGTPNQAPTNGTDPNIAYNSGGTTASAYVTPSQIGALTGNVHLEAAHNLTVASPLGYGGGDLTLDAGNNLTVNAGAPISVTNGRLVLRAASDLVPAANAAGTLSVQGSLTSANAIVLNGGSGGIALSASVTAGSDLLVGTPGAIIQTAGIIQTTNLYGRAGSVSLSDGGNRISGIGTGGTGAQLTTTAGGVNVATSSVLAVGSAASTTTGIAVPAGQTIALSADSINLAAPAGMTSLSAPNGTVVVIPQTNGTGITLTSSATKPTGVLSLTTAELKTVTAGTLQLGDSSLSVGSITLGQPGETVDLLASGGFGTLALYAGGPITQGGPLLTNAVIGHGNTVTLDNAANQIARVGPLDSSSSLSLTTGGDLSVAGNVTASGFLGLTAGGSISVTPAASITAADASLTAASASAPSPNAAGAITLGGPVTADTVILASGTGGITLASTLVGNQGVVVNTTGPLVQTGGSVTTGDLSGTALSVSLPSRSNAIDGVASRYDTFEVSGAAGDFTLVDSVALAVGSVSAGGGLSVQNGRTITLQTNALTVQPAGEEEESSPALTAPGGTIAITPFTVGNPIILTDGPAAAGSLVLSTATLSGMQATTLQLGTLGTAGTPTAGAITFGQSGETFDLGATGNFTNLVILATGAVTQGGPLGVTTIGGQAGQLTLTYGTASGSNFIPTLNAFVTTGGDLALHTGSGLTVAGPLSATSVGGAAANIALSSTDAIPGVTDPSGRPVSMQLNASLTGAIVSLNSSNGTPSTSGGITQTAGLITATSLTGVAGYAALSQPNQISQVNDFLTYQELTVSTVRPLLVTGTVVSTTSAITFNAAGITQTPTSSLSAIEFDGSSSATTLLANNATITPGVANNAIQSIGYFTQAADDFTLATSSPVLNFSAGGTVSATHGSLNFIADGVGLGPSVSVPGGISAPQGLVSFAPFTPSRRIELIGGTAADPASLSLSQTFLNRITPTQVILLGNASSTGAINIANAGETVTIPGSAELQLQTTGPVTEGVSPGGQNGGGTLALQAAEVAGTVGTIALNAPGNQIIQVGGGAPASGSLSGLIATGSITIDDGRSLTLVNRIAANATNGSVTVDVNGSLSNSSGSVSASAITLDAGAGALQLGAALTTGGTLNAVNLTAVGGAVTQTAGAITTGFLTVAGPSVSLPTASNQITTLSGATVAGALTLAEAGPLSIAGGTVGGTFSLTSATGAAGVGTVTINGPLVTGNFVTALSGALAEGPAGTLQATGLSGNAASVSLGNANAVNSLGGFTTATGFQLVDGQALTVAGPVTDGQSVALTTTVGGLTLTGNLSAPTVTLISAAALNQTGGGVTATTLNGSSTGATVLTATGNAVGTLAGFSSAGGFSLTDGRALTVTGPVADATSVALNVTGGLTLNGAVQTGALTLTATGSITQPGGAITANSLAGNAAGATLTATGNRVATLANFASTGNFALTDGVTVTVAGAVSVASGGTLTLTDDSPSFGARGSLSAPGGTVALREYTAGKGITVGGGGGLTGTPPVTAQTLQLGIPTGGPVTIAGAFNLSTVTVLDLESRGAIAETGAGAIRVATLTGNGASASLGGANQVGTLGGFTTTTGFQLVDGQALTVAGPLTDGQSVALTTTVGGLTLAGNVTAPSVTLISAAAVNQTGGVVTATTLNGSSTGATALTAGGNAIGTLAGFSSAGGFSLADGRALTVSGPVADATSVALNVTGGLTLNAAVQTATATLTAAGALTEGANGQVVATTLTGSASSASLGGTNHVGTLGGFSTTNGFALTNAQGLAVAGPVTDGQSVALTTTAGGLTLAGNVTAPSVTLTSAAAVNQTGGGVTATTLNGSSAGATSLTATGNAIGTLAGFSSAGGFSLADGRALTVSGPVTDGTSVALNVTGGVTLNGSVQTGALTLAATGVITQPGGAITANSLAGNVAGATLTASGNSISTLGRFASTGNFALTDRATLTVSGAVSVASGGTLTLTDDSPSFGAGGSLSAPGGTVALREFTPGRGIVVAGGGGLTGTPAVTAQTLMLGTGTGGPVTIAGAFNLSTVTVLDLESGGAIAETGAGAIRVATLTGNGASASLGGANQVGTLGGFTTTNGFALTNAQALTVGGPLTDGQSVALTTTAGALALAGNVTAPSVTLTSAASIGQSGGSIATASLTGSSTGSTSLTAGGNVIGTLAGFSSAGGFSLADGRALTVSGPVTDGTSVALNVTGGLTLNGSVQTGAASLSASGALSEGANGQVVATTLTGSASSASLGGMNQVGTLGAFTTANGFALTNTQALAVAGPVTDGQAVALTTTAGGLTLAGNVTAPSVTLTSAAAVNQTGGAITTASLAGSSAGATALTAGGNAIGTLAGFSSAGGFNLADGQALAVSGPVADATSVALNVMGGLTLNGSVQTGALTLTATGAITQPGGAITANSLAGNAAGATLTATGNRVATLANFASTGNFALTDRAPVTVSGAVSVASGGTLTLTDDSPTFGTGGSLSAPGGTVALQEYTAGNGITVGGGGGLTGTPPVMAQTLRLGIPTGGPVTIAGVFNLSTVTVLDLESGGAIAETGAGAIRVATLTGHGASSSLGGANQVGTLGAFTTNSGFALTNAQALTVGGPLTDGQSVALTTTAGALTLAGNVTAPSVTLTSAGGIGQSGGAVITASLAGSSAGATALTAGGNAIGTLAGFSSAGGFSLADGQALTVTGPVADATSVVLNVTGGLTLNGSVQTGGLTLAATGALNEGASGQVVATTLTGSAQLAGLGGANQVGTLGAFATTAGFALTDSQALTVAGPVTDGQSVMVSAAGRLTVSGQVIGPVVSLVASGAGGAIVQTTGSISGATSVTLTSLGAINQVGGTIATATLTGSSTGVTSLTAGGNAIGTLAGFSSAGGFSLADGRALTLSGPVTDTTSVALNVTGGLTLNGSVQTGALTLAATGAITQPGGAITANSLAGNAAGATLTASGNRVATLANFASTGNFALTDRAPLTVSGAVSVASGGTLTLTDDSPSFGAGGSLSAPGGTVALREFTPGRGIVVAGGGGLTGTPAVTAQTLMLGTGTGGPVTIAGAFNLSTVTVLDLESGGAIAETGAGAIRVATLIGNGASASLGGANQVGTLGGFTTTNGFALTNAQALTVGGPLTDGQSVALTTTAGALALAGNVTAPSVTLISAASIGQSGGSIATASLTGSSTGSTSLTAGGNVIGTLAGFSSAGGFSLADGRALTVSGPVTDTTSVTLNVTGGLMLNSVVQTGAASLSASGALSEGANGQVVATTLTGSASSASLGGMNQVGTLGAFTTANGFALTNTQALAVAGPVTDGQAVALTTTAGGLTLAGNVTAPSVTLTSAMALNQTGGAITTASLAGSSAGATALTAGGNAIGTLAGFSSAGGFSLADGQALAVSGPVADATSVALNVMGGLTLNGAVQTGALTLTATGAITQPGGAIIANSLTGNAAGATLTASGNRVSTLANFASTGNLALTDRAPVTVSSAVSVASGGTLTLTDDSPTFGTGGSLLAPGGTVALREYTAGNGITVGGGGGLAGTPPVTAQTLRLGIPTGGPVTIAGAFNLSTVTVLDLESGGAIAETGAGAIRVATLTGNGASASLGGANQVGTLGAVTTNSGFALTNAQALAVAGPVTDGQSVALTTTAGGLTLAGNVTAPSVTLTSAAAVNQTGGVVTATTLSGSSTGVTSLTAGGNAIGTLAGFSSAGGFSLADGQALTLSGPVTDTISVALNVTGGLTLNGSVQTGALTLAATGAIAQPGGSLTANSLSGSAADVTLTAGGNSIATLGRFASTGNFALMDSAPVTVSGAVSVANGGTLTLIDSSTAFGAGGLLSAPGGTVRLQAPTPSIGITLAGGAGLAGTPPIAAQTLTLGSATGGSVTLAGAFNFSGVAVLDLESGSAIAETGTGAIRVATLTGNGASATLGGPNQIGTLGSFNAPGGLTLSNAQTLATSGTQSAGSVNLTVAGDLALSSVITAPASVSLTVTGAITQPAGSVATASLTGSAASASLGSTGNLVGTLAGFTTPGDLLLADGRSLLISAPMASNTLTLPVNGDLTLASSVTGNTVLLNATGTILETGPGQIMATTLTGSARSATLTGLNQVAALADFRTTAGLAISDAQGLSVVGGVADQQAVTLAANGPLTVRGTISAPGITLATIGGGPIAQVGGAIYGTSVALDAAGAITQTAGSITTSNGLSLMAGGPVALGGAIKAGNLTFTTPGSVMQTGGSITAAALSGSATGPVALGTVGTATVAAVGDLSSASFITLQNAGALQLGGTLAAPTLTVTAVGRLALAGGTIHTNAGQPAATLQVLPGADGTASFVQTGTTSVAPYAGGASLLRIVLPASRGTLTLDNLQAAATDVVLSLGTGTATGTLNVANLTVLGAGGSAAFAGEAAGRVGTDAAQVSSISPQVSAVYTLNGCSIAAVTCTAQTSVLTSTIATSLQASSLIRPDILTLDVLDLSVTRDRDDPTLQLPNISDRDY